MLPAATPVRVRIGQKEKLGSDAVSKVAQLILEGALELGWPFEARGLGFYIPALVNLWMWAIPGGV